MTNLLLDDLGLREWTATRLLPESLARRHHLLALRDDDLTITVAVTDPDASASDAYLDRTIRSASGRAILFRRASESQIAAAIDTAYLASGQPSWATPARHAENVARTGARIMVVDDDPVCRLMAARVCASAGYVVDTATDGADALHRIASGLAIDLLLTDVEMPSMDGRALIAHIRGREREHATPPLPIIVMSGEDDHADEIALLSAGANDYLRKPIEPMRVASRVRAVLRRGSHAYVTSAQQ